MTADTLPQDGSVLPAPEAPAPPLSAEEEEKKKRRRKAFILFFLLGALVLLFGLFIWYLLFRQPINPIPIIPTSQVPTYSTSLNGITRPMGIAVDPSGDRIYVMQGGAAASGVVLDGNGKLIATMALPATGDDHLPVYAAVDPKGSEVYVSDRMAGAIYIFGRDGEYLRTFTPAEPRTGWQPMGMAFDGDGNLYVTDFAAGSVVEFDRDGKVVRTIGKADGLTYPNGVAVDKDGIVYVADSDNGRLLAYDKEGKVVARVGRGANRGMLGNPRGLAIDGQGRLFVADSTGSAIQIYGARTQDQGISFLGSFGAAGSADGEFQYPNDVAVDGRGHVYVADTFTDRIQIWSY